MKPKIKRNEKQERYFIAATVICVIYAVVLIICCSEGLVQLVYAGAGLPIVILIINVLYSEANNWTREQLSDYYRATRADRNKITNKENDDEQWPLR